MFDAVLLPRHRAAWVFFVDATPLLVEVVFLAVAGRIVPVITTGVPRIEGFSEFRKNALTGLAVQSLVLRVNLQLIFEVAVVGNLVRFLPDLSGVIVGDVVRLCLTGSQTESENVPEFAGRPSVPVGRVLYLSVVADFRSVGAMDFQHSK